MARSKHMPLPDDLDRKLRTMGEDIAAARKVRRMTQEDLAERIGVSRITVVRMERGDAGTSFGALAGAAWVMGLEDALTGAFSPDKDPVFQREARLGLPQRVRPRDASHDTDELDF